jgi:hypothetical protein
MGGEKMEGFCTKKEGFKIIFIEKKYNNGRKNNNK